MSTSEKYPDYLSQSASEIPSGEDIEAMIARLDQKWRELKQLLRAEEDAAGEEGQAPPLALADVAWQEAVEPGDSWWRSLLPPAQRHADVTAQEAEAIVEKVEKLDQEADIREQLVKIQWQKRGLLVYSVICTIMFLYLLVSIFLSSESYALSQKRKNPAAEVHLAADPTAPVLAAAVAPPSAAAAAAGYAQSSPPGTQGALALSPESAATAPAQDPAKGLSSTGDTPASKMEYLGSLTSNKYHYRSCKWAKFIIPRKERVFHSVADARQAGYISCPTCRPPLTDDIQTSAR
jgi:hypothetical protein